MQERETVPLGHLLRPPAGWKRLGSDLWREIQEHHITSGAAAVAYYSMLSIFPAAIVFVSILPYLGIENLDRAIMDLLRQAMPAAAAELFTTTVQRVVSERHGGLLSAGIAGTLWAASSGISALMDQLDVTYEVQDTRPYWKTRGLSILLVVLLGLMLVVALGLVVFGGILQQKIAEYLGFSKSLLAFFATLRWVVIFAPLTISLAITYWIGPDVKQPFRVLTPGSLFGASALVLSALAFRTYVEHFGKYEATYGSLGAAIVLLLWLYVGALVILGGSEVNATLERQASAAKRAS